MKIKDAKKGFAMLTVVFVMVSFAVVGVAAVAMIAGSSQMVMDGYRSSQAFYVAEAGLEYTAQQLKADGNWTDNANFTKTFGPGAFTITYTNQTTDSALVQSEGIVAGISRRVSRQMTASGFAGFEYGMYTPSDIIVGGSSAGTVNGPVSAGGTVGTGGGVNFNGDIEQHNSSAAIPTPDWAYWQNHATQTISGNYKFDPGTYNGIYYVTGNVQVTKDVILNGSIIARGSISTEGGQSVNITITAGAGNPALLAEGSISMAGSSHVNITGWIFSVSTVTFTGSSDINATGGVVAGGSITMTGTTNIDLTFNPALAPSAGFNGGERGSIVLGSWREV